MLPASHWEFEKYNIFKSHLYGFFLCCNAIHECLISGKHSNAEVWLDFQSGNQEALTFIYKTYIQNVYNFGRQISNDERVVENRIQELFIDLRKHMRSLSSVTSINFTKMIEQ